MDPLAHTLTGANLAATRLGGKTRFAAAALVVGANLPDVDGILYLLDDRDLALGFRRGWTHGVLAIVVLPFVLTGLLMLWDRLRPDPGRRVSPGWLLLLSALAVATHPTLDWLNTYGMRWLMPFRPDWFYGDAVNIMDPWIWLVLGSAWLLGRKPTWWLVGLWAFFTWAVVRIVASRAPEYVVLIGVIAAILLVALLLRAPAKPTAQRIAAAALVVTGLYIGSRIAIVAMTRSAVSEELAGRGIHVEEVMLSPHPLDPRPWAFVARTADRYHHGTTLWFGRDLHLAPKTLPVAQPSPEWEAAHRVLEVHGFLTWVRFPSYEVERDGDTTRVLIYDARRLTRGGDLRARVIELE